ncbi:hypothetical protein H8K35_06455 [Undibacterium sp. LX40W]|uniref:Integrase catalytic domain-containing protein n=1 Tax=Undibacterium nitidum TaxID=2762298 RepID=A0A923HJ21_9BURK|nr:MULTISPECIES: hypothetical protein [Undibacterium]MBC3879972.1 hypothetical protein [Undibacterium nitidum]MBC3891292.1 hypothetical protein [Undibacterium sp. LX40W]
MTEYDFEDTDRFSKRIVGGKTIDTSTWRTPDVGALNGDASVKYHDRKEAILLYLSGESDESIKQKTGIGSKQAYRLIRERCLEIHPDGSPYGWRALVHYTRMKPYRRQKKIVVDQFGLGAAGAMKTLLEKHPELRDSFEKKILSNSNSKKLVEIKKSKTRITGWFLEELRKLGYEARQEWPFNTNSKAYFTVSRYIDDLLIKNPKALAMNVGGPELVNKLKTGDGTNRPVLKFMQRVEMDAHKLDGRFCISIPLLDGDYKEKIIHRLWVIVILEVVSRAVIGYYFSTRKEVSADDALRAIKCGLNRWSPRDISFSNVAYSEKAGLLSSLGKDFVGLCWEETSVDGALAETCKTVKETLKNAVGSTLISPDSSFSQRRSKDDRPFIEAFFKNLAGKGFQRLSNTTGAKPKDKKGRDPDDVALTSRFQYEYAEELLDVLIANYNMSCHSGIGGRKPLEYATFLMKNSGLTPRYADPDLVQSFFSLRKRCRVRGGAKTGRAPFIEFGYARYTNEILQNRQDLVGTEIWVINHKENDARMVLASTISGTPLGVLRAAPPWNISPHSLSVRKAIYQASAKGKFNLAPGGDGIECFLNYVENTARGKLPVHPAYIEARRILVESAEQLVGTSMLEAAKARARELNVGSSSEPIDSKNAGVAETKPNVPKSAGNNQKPDKLPARRMASTR